MLPLILWLAGSPVIADEAKATTPSSDGASPDPGRAGFTTGLGDMALSQAFPDAALWLELEENDRALGLFYPEREPPAEGALVILADVGGNAASGLVGGLSEQLIERGWAVLSVGLPAPSVALQQTLEANAGARDGRPEDEEASAVMIDVMASPDAESPEHRYRSRVRQSVEVAIDVLESRGYDQPVLIGVGRASGHLVTVRQALPNPGAMIWVAPEFYPRDAATLSEHLAAGGPGILELYSSRRDSDEAVRRRWADLQQSGGDAYERQPVSLQQPPSAQDAPAVAGRIDAWLKSR